MTVATRRRSRTPASEEAVAAVRLVLSLTVAVGGMAAAIGVATDAPIAVVGLPTLVLLVAIAWRAPVVAGWAAAAVWLCLLPSADGEAVLAPLAMIVLCLAIAIGPDRFLSWIGRDLAGHRGAAGEPAARGWIEEDGRPVD